MRIQQPANNKWATGLRWSFSKHRKWLYQYARNRPASWSQWEYWLSALHIYLTYWYVLKRNERKSLLLFIDKQTFHVLAWLLSTLFQLDLVFTAKNHYTVKDHSLWHCWYALFFHASPVSRSQSCVWSFVCLMHFAQWSKPEKRETACIVYCK